MTEFTIQAAYDLTGDQPEAVDALGEGVLRGDRFQTLLGVTGSGKTFTMANVIARAKKPTLVIATTRRWRRSSATSSASSCPTTRWSTSSATTTTTSEA